MDQYKKDMLDLLRIAITAKDDPVETISLFHEGKGKVPQVIVTFVEYDYAGEYSEPYSTHLNVVKKTEKLKAEQKKLKSEIKHLESECKTLEKTNRVLNSKTSAKAVGIALEYLKERVNGEISGCITI
jgi:hypothetical protein